LITKIVIDVHFHKKEVKKMDSLYEFKIKVCWLDSLPWLLKILVKSSFIYLPILILAKMFNSSALLLVFCFLWPITAMYFIFWYVTNVLQLKAQLRILLARIDLPLDVAIFACKFGLHEKNWNAARFISEFKKQKTKS